MTTDLETIDPYQLADCILSLVTNAEHLSPEFHKKTIHNIEHFDDRNLFVIQTKQSISFGFYAKENKIIICYSSRTVYTFCYNSNQGGWASDITNQKLVFLIIGTLEKFKYEYDRIVESHFKQVLDLEEEPEEPFLVSEVLALSLQEQICDTEIEYKKRTFFSKFASWSWIIGGVAMIPYSAFFSLVSMVVAIAYISKFRQEQVILKRLKEASCNENEKQLLALEGIIEKE